MASIHSSRRWRVRGPTNTSKPAKKDQTAYRYAALIFTDLWAAISVTYRQHSQLTAFYPTRFAFRRFRRAMRSEDAAAASSSDKTWDAEIDCSASADALSANFTSARVSFVPTGSHLRLLPCR